MRKHQKGFTLIELMIVVAIIGILAAIALPKFADMLEKSREGATKGNFTAIKSAMNMYIADQGGERPVILSDTHPTGGTDFNFVRKYMDKIPPVKATGKNEANPSPQGQGPGTSSQGEIITAKVQQTTWGSFLAAGKGWRYDSGEGRIWVNSNLLDMTNQIYTTYGYQ